MNTYVRSEIAKLYATFSFGGLPVDPTNLRITIYHGDDVVVAATTMTKISTGYYYYEFTVPASWDEDFYSAVYTGQINATDFKQEETFRIIAQETLTSSSLPTTEYCTLGDVQKELVGVNYDELDGIDEIIIDEIYRATHEVDRKCNRPFKQLRQTDYINGNDSPNVLAPHIPVNEVHSAQLLLAPSVDWYTFENIALINTKMDNGIEIATPATYDEYQAADLLVDCLSGQLNIPERIRYIGQASFPFWNYTFVGGYRNVRIDYTYGFTSTTRPREITEMAAKIVAIKVLERKGDQIGGGSVSLSLDGVGHSYQGVPYGVRIERMQNRIDEIARRYIKLGVG
jgi:hypothetical protein